MSLAFGLDGRILIIGKRENKKERIASYLAKKSPNPCIIQKKAVPLQPKVAKAKKNELIITHKTILSYI